MTYHVITAARIYELLMAAGILVAIIRCRG